MSFLSQTVHFFMHLDQALGAVVQGYDAWTYLILFVVVFCETGLVVTPILPGDSLLFAAKGDLSLGILFLVFTAAGILGDTVNYAVGRRLGPPVFQKQGRWVFKKEHLDRTRAFFERYGGKTIVLARFVPIVRTFAPFVAGVGEMNYGRFLSYNVGGALAWVSLGLLSGYWFGNLPAVKEHFTLVLLAIVFVSVLPAVIEGLRSRSRD